MNSALFLGLVLLLSLIIPLHQTGGAEPKPAALPEAVGTLAAAKAKAEDAVLVVKQYASDNATIQIEAMHDYSNARAAFNGFIESLVTERNPEAAALSSAYKNNLVQAKQAEEVFVTFVQTNVVAPLPKGGKAPIGDLLDGIGNLFTGLGKLGDSVATVHQEFTRESDERRKQTQEQLNGLKWQQFSKIQ